MARDEASDRAVLEAALSEAGLVPEAWDLVDGVVVARLGTWRLVEEDEERMLYWDDGDGELIAQVVGSPEYRNQRVSYNFTPKSFDRDSGPEVQPFMDVEPA